ncbi:trypsin-like peptidase domain-containing protein [Thalassomonas actiniarum]|uniref:Serine protease n=1 Tax=Thalassomonas actiniarum TaxID=485447 RepID=A0AAE9YVM0_9GAMM|nr:trypsin-like peptidase domain-containing protein [Thalassomonas actiniarum]WDE02095.1 trypsin-like peptidase domain-containing protein [Thalassomonas actiniarum]
MATSQKKITYRQLLDMVKNLDIDESSIAQYLQIDEKNSLAFSPAIKINPERVEMGEDEGEVLLSAFNWLCKKRRQKQYRRKINSGYQGIRIVSEGDSWFQYPIILKDVIDQLFDKYAIYSLGGAGHLLNDMIDEDEITDAVVKEKPDVLLLSAGGNDMVGDRRLATMVDPFDNNDPRRPVSSYINSRFDDFLTELIALYSGLFTRLTSRFPLLVICVHGYDWAIAKKGRWLGKPLASVGFENPDDQTAIVYEMINRFNTALQSLVSNFAGNVRYIDCRGAVAEELWFDELHPDNNGFKSVAARFESMIEAAVAEQLRLLPEQECPGEDAFITSRPLSNQDEAYIACRRARQRGLKVAKVNYDHGKGSLTKAGKGAREEISRYYEKIDLSNDLLKASFLHEGSSKADAVCRIRTPVSSGTGFLIINSSFILTNNHVLEDIATARASIVQFDYEDNENAINVRLQPERFFITNKDLDYTVTACDTSAIENRSAIRLLRDPTTVSVNERVNIVQHPEGRTKEVALRNNQVMALGDHVVHYRTDTQPGSSGSPVFNDDWDLVALHHAGWMEGPQRAINEGIRIASIVNDLILRSRSESTSSALLAELISGVQGSSPFLGFFDIEGVLDDQDLEGEVPNFRGSADFADVMFWNIEHFNNGVSNTRVNKVASIINDFSMDVMGLVEVQEGAMKKLVEALRLKGTETDFEILDVRGSQDLSVLYNRDTTEVMLRDDLNQKYADLLDARTRGGKRAFPREPLFAECTVKADNHGAVKFMLIVLHLKAFGDAASRARRTLASEKLVNIIKDIRDEQSLPVIMGGDYNDILNTEVFAALQDSPDLFALTADDSDSDAATYVGGSRRSVIDHIVISRDLSPADISGDDAAIVRIDKSMADFVNDISDHVPLAMRLVMRGTPVDYN